MMKLGAAVGLICVAACGGNRGADIDPSDAAGSGGEMPALASSVGVEVGSDSVRMVLHVTNPTNQPVVLEFSSGQRYDFAVRTVAGVDVWRWSADKSFMQALGSETIPPGGTLDYAEVWLPGNRTGSFIAVAELTSLNHRVREQAAFQFP
jgi:hypothetical protein